MASPSRTLAMGQDEATAADRASVEAPFGQALVEAGARPAGDRRPYRRPRQVHRHPAVPRRVSRPFLQRRHGGAEPRRDRRRPGADRQDPLRHDLRRLRHAARLRLHRHRRRPQRRQRQDHRRAARPHHRLWRHAPGDRGPGADAHDPRPRHHRPLRRHRHRPGDRRDRRPIPGPVYMRLLRGAVPVVLDPATYSFEIGKARRLRDGSDVGIIATGMMTERALDAAAALANARHRGGRAARADDQAVRRRRGRRVRGVGRPDRHRGEPRHRRRTGEPRRRGAVRARDHEAGDADRASRPVHRMRLGAASPVASMVSPPIA